MKTPTTTSVEVGLLINNPMLLVFNDLSIEEIDILLRFRLASHRRGFDRDWESMLMRACESRSSNPLKPTTST